MEVLHEFHACDGARLPFGTACSVLGQHRQDIITQAALVTAREAGTGMTGGWLGAQSRVVTAPLEGNGQRSATMAMHWVQAGAAGSAGAKPTAWLHGHLRLLPRQAGGEAITELLLTARCEVSPSELGVLDNELCARFLRNVVAELERTAATPAALG